ncbi:MAG: MMPL family transporter [Pikeienuella sp.]
MTHRAGHSWPHMIALLALVLVPVLFGMRLAATGVSVDSDIQSILPETSASAAEVAAIQQASAAVAARIVIGVRGGSPEQDQAGAERLHRAMMATGLFVPSSADMAETTAWVHANRFDLACERDLNRMDAKWGDALAAKARGLIFSGMVPLSGVKLGKDPFLLQLGLLECLAPGAGPASANAVVSGRIVGSPYELNTQNAIKTVLNEWQAAPANHGLSLLRSGAVFFALEAGAQAKREITMVGGISVVLILLLYTLAFRHPVTAGIALLTVFAGALGGAWLCFVVFGTVHFSVFVFGSALTGVSADYAVHSLAARRSTPNSRPPGLRRALTISMLTSASGFAALLFFGIDLFRQIGVFSIGGLLFAWLFALTALPVLDRKRNAPTGKTRLTAPIAAIFRSKAIALGAIAGAMAVTFWGAMHVSFVDDLRQFQTLSPPLTAERTALFGKSGGQFSTNFLLSSGKTLEEALLQEEALIATSDAGAERFLAFSAYAPSEARRAATRTAYEAHLLAPHVEAMRAALGLPHTDLKTAPSDAPLPSWLSALRFERGGMTYLIAPILEPPILGQSSSFNPPEGERVISPPQKYGAALQIYRQQAFAVIGLAAIAAALFLMLVYRSARAAWLIAPSVIGCAVALCLPGLLGVPVTLFSVLALFIVLGAGIDFSVFQWEMKHDETGWTGTAVLIAALSSCVAMGMLGFSETLPVQTFGITIAVGVLCSMAFSFLAPLAAPKTG